MKFINPSGYRHKKLPLRRENKRYGCIKLLIIVLIVAVVLFFLYRLSLLNSESIRISGLNLEDESSVRTQILNNAKGKPAFVINDDYITSIVQDRFSTFKVKEIKRKFPNKLELNVSMRDEKYNIQASNGLFVADEDGMVLGAITEATESIDLNVIYDRSLEVGKKIEDTAVQAGLIYSELNQTVKIENDQIHIDMDNGGKIILPKNSAVSKVNDFFTMLQKLIQKYTIDNRQIEFIDLRFSKPVIKYEE